MEIIGSHEGSPGVVKVTNLRANLTAGRKMRKLMIFMTYLIVRLAKAARWLQTLLNYTKKVKLSTSIVFGHFPSLSQLI